jgi:PIN domain nuclease of toxin-antitoxin system
LRVLLDTHALIWWATSDPRLSSRAIALIEDPDGEVVISAISVLEIAIKSARGGLSLGATPRQFIQDEIVANNFAALALTFDHAERVYDLPQIHRDPFDRVLIAQAMVEGIPIVTDNAMIRRYAVSVEW